MNLVLMPGWFEGNADYVLIAEFSSESAFRSYVVNPLHREFLKSVAGPLLDSYSSAQFTF